MKAESKQEQLLNFEICRNDDDFKVEFELISTDVSQKTKSTRRKAISESISELEDRSRELDERIIQLNNDIERLTNHADGLDYSVAVGCGVLCGLIDSFVIGEFDFNNALEKSKTGVENFVKQTAENIRGNDTFKKALENAKLKASEKGETLSTEDIKKLKEKISAGVKETFNKINETDNGTAKALQRAIKKLEEKFSLTSDNLFSGANIGVNATTHHLDDLAHHPTLLGLIAAVAGELFRLGIFTNKDGIWSFKVAKLDKKKMLQMWTPIIISGVLSWLLFIVKSKNREKIDEMLPKPIQNIILALVNAPAAITVLSIAKNWLGHLVSDMAGSSSSAGIGRDGMGIPGLFVSMLKEISSIPPLNLTSLPGVVNNIFSEQRFDMRSELALINSLGKQAIPVILGDILVRTFYFVRHLIVEVKEKKELKKIDWKKVIPFNNRTIARMMTIESGTFTAIDLADAAIRAGTETVSGTIPEYLTRLVLRVNFVGVGRFAIALCTDVGMGVKRQKARDERLRLKGQQLNIENSKLSYIQEGMWIQAEETAQAINKMLNSAKVSMIYFAESLEEIEQNLDEIGSYIEKTDENNPGLINEINDILVWG